MIKNKIKLIIITLGCLAALAGCQNAQTTLSNKTFGQLEDIRTERKVELLAYFEQVYEVAASARVDPEMLSHFASFQKTYENDPSYALKASPAIQSLEKHYVTQYSEFYDVLFVAGNGDVFYSVKAESDYGDNLFNGALKNTRLSNALLDSEAATFVDFALYDPSGEPAAFITVPIEGPNGGWIIFQLPLNTVNFILDQQGRFKKTGEVYLTNSNKIMMSQSRFINGDTPLHLRVDTVALDSALEDGAGNITTNDYRGVRVFSSFEKINFHNSTWIIVAEIDEDEVITSQYIQNRDEYAQQLFSKPVYGAASKYVLEVSEDDLRVDINEFAKALPKQSLSLAFQ